MKRKEIKYVSGNGNEFSAQYHRIRHWRYKHSGVLQRVMDRFWCGWSVWLNQSVPIEHGFEPLFPMRRSMRFRLRSAADRWETQNQ